MLYISVVSKTIMTGSFSCSLLCTEWPRDKSTYVAVELDWVAVDVDGIAELKTKGTLYLLLKGCI